MDLPLTTANTEAAWRSGGHVVPTDTRGMADSRGVRPQLRKNTPWVSWLNTDLELKPGRVLFWGLRAAGRPKLEGSSV